ncbi:peptidylprolyl isomerase [Marinococcus sp. PL1-022]|uniref:peptidylprolyl isomerase n=1 Tax=Marinococcus sp. PL1-022 TaxID=3095363 RepID=UPI0029C5E18F|nr:peptidylprolyl isomerase [Marinococcus sp. PL1-022]MDX6153426.1 peptidylprolyl isomerase [Marinococcus sp. PL1-022]
MKKYIFTAVSLSGALLLASCSNQGSAEESNTIVEVNGESISEQELMDDLKENYGENALNNLVQQKVLNNKAEELEISDKQVNKEFKSMKEQYGIDDNDQFLQTIQQNMGVQVESIKAFKEQYVKPQLVVEELGSQDVEVTEEEMKNYYDENKEEVVQVEASHILVESEKEANEIIKELEGGADFAELAKEKSIDTASGESGGELGYFGKGEMTEAFEKAAFDMEVDSISEEPVETEHGFHVIKVTGKKDSYDELKDDIKQTLKTEEQKDGQQVLNEIMQEADINVEDKDYKDWVKTYTEASSGKSSS